MGVRTCGDSCSEAERNIHFGELEEEGQRNLRETKMSRSRALNLMSSVGAASCSCPAHSQAFSAPSWVSARPPAPSPHTGPKDYAFEMACSNIRYGPGVTQEVGLDMASLGAKNVGVYTDSTLVNLPP